MNKQWLSFQVGLEIYIQAIESVKEIIYYSTPIALPGSQRYIEGVISARGDVISVLSSQSLFGHKSQLTDDNW